MSLPIYRMMKEEHPNRIDPEGNVGLWFTRFYSAFDATWKVGDEGKGNWIRTVEGPRGDRAVLEAAANRSSMLGKALGAEVADFKTDWHFATGLGLSHPVENGFTWHHTLGLPYLPASGVKGLLRGWVEAWVEHPDVAARDAVISRWFGAAKGTEGQVEGAGGLIFFDAIPTQPVTLACDVMTPHMGKWYEQGGQIERESDFAERAPADWHSPVPVPFLVVKQASFRFMIAPRLCGDKQGDAQAREDAKTAMAQLAEALEWLGAGAKTAAGYGRMCREGAEAAAALAEAGIVQASGVVWQDAKATWDKGKQALTVSAGAEKTSPLSGAEAKDLFNGLSEAAQKRLKDGKNLNVSATVDKSGNRTRLVTVTEIVVA
ncbi:MAG: type III-B CRISPR module RAMP protein Cmr6 [Oxalobacteraceae bacterium]|nr:type III-B CRISPR module RAMP protein Cmr6 [Oxalobacteraceae bacterium]